MFFEFFVNFFILHRFTNNYGILGLLDWLHGTDFIYRKSVQFKRDYIIMDLVPAIDKYPDEKNKDM